MHSSGDASHRLATKITTQIGRLHARSPDPRPVTQSHKIGRHYLSPTFSIRGRLDWSAGGERVAGRGSCQGRPTVAMDLAEVAALTRHSSSMV